MRELFEYDGRLDLEVPKLEREWEEYPHEERASILERWERIRGAIPDRIARFEAEIAGRQELLHGEEDWDRTLALMDEIHDYSSRIADLNILYRTQPDSELAHDRKEEHRDREK